MPDPVPKPAKQRIVPVWEQATKALEQRKQAIEWREQKIITEGEAHEVNPWLERAGWHTYLAGLDREKLLESVDRPDEETEPVLMAIWTAMDEMIQHCQYTATHRVGIFVRLEAIRTEKHQTRYQPLQGYMNAKLVQEYGRPWKQMVMFIGRTYHAPEWQVPKYTLQNRQRKAWKRLMAKARESLSDDEENEPDDNEGGSSSENLDSVEDNNLENVNSQDDQAALAPFPKACLEFCISLLDEQIRQNEYNSVMVCALAVLGVKKDGWLGPDRYPSILSAVIKLSRFMVIQDALETAGPIEPKSREGRRPSSSSDSSSESSNHNSSSRDRQIGFRKDCLGLVKEAMDRFMVRGSHSPMQWMLDLRTYGLKIQFNTTTEGTVDWVGDQIVYKNIQFTMAELRSMIHELVAETKRMLVHELMFITDPRQLPRIPWPSLRDNPVNGERGWNFVQDERNPWPVDGQTWLRDRVGKDDKIRGRFIEDGQILKWKKAGIREYMDRVVNFRGKLLPSTHMTGGQPGRFPEISSIRYRNSVKGEHRNIFIEDGLVVFATRYHKGYHLQRKEKIIHRYLPRDVGEIMVYYEWLVRPFVEVLEAEEWDRYSISPFVWPADPSGKEWTSGRMSKCMQNASQSGMGVKMGIQAWRDIAIGISRKFLRSTHAFRWDEDDEDGDFHEDEAYQIQDEQAAHTSHVAGMVYARGIMELSGVVASKRQRFREASTEWHQFLGFDPTPVQTGHKRGAAPFESEAEDASFRRWKRMRGTDIQGELRRMMGPQARFRGVQKAAIEAIMKGESPVVMVMGTGGGKSLGFMLPAWCSQGGTSIVVVPLIALRQDMKDRCRRLGIECAEWNGQRPPRAARIVLVTPEAAIGDRFNTFMNRLQSTQQLDRIVIDECHVVLNDQLDFRRKLQRMGELNRAAVQMIMLTATLPPRMEGRLWERMGWRAEMVRMFRAGTVRKNVKYRTIRIATQDQNIEGYAQIIQQAFDPYADGKMVVYCNSVRKSQDLAQQMRCEAYYHDAREKTRKLIGFKNEDRLIVATSAFGMGIDIENIRVVVHVDRPRTLLDYAQESGRAGRDGLSSEAIIIDSDQQVEKEMGGSQDEKLVQRFMIGEECRRRVLDEYLDGRMDRMGCEEGEEPCERCQIQ